MRSISSSAKLPARRSVACSLAHSITSSSTPVTTIPPWESPLNPVFPVPRPSAIALALAIDQGAGGAAQGGAKRILPRLRNVVQAHIVRPPVALDHGHAGEQSRVQF